MNSAHLPLPASPCPVSGAAPAERHAYLRALWELLASYRYLFNNEAELHRALATLLERNSHSFEHEKVLSPSCRVDFWLPLPGGTPESAREGVVIEVKVQGSYADALRQGARYAGLPEVHGVLIASTRLWAKQGGEAITRVDGTPLMVVHMTNRAF